MAVRLPPPEIVRYFHAPIYQFLVALGAAYAITPFGISSLWRSVNQNVAAGGAPYSQHLIGTAADVYPIRSSLWQVERALKNQGLVTVPYERHVHAQLWKAGRLERLLRDT